MTISLGRRLPGASSDLPGSRNGPGQPAARRIRWLEPADVLPYLVLLPVGFTEPSRSPDLLVSFYLAVSPLPRTTEKASAAVCFLWHFPFPDQSERWALPTTAP